MALRSLLRSSLRGLAGSHQTGSFGSMPQLCRYFAVKPAPETTVSSDKGSMTRGDGLSSRFYKQVGVAEAPTGGWSVLLDERVLRTPAKHPLVLPTRSLALALAAEWEWQASKTIRPYTMPLTGLCATAIDQMPLTRHETVPQLLMFFGADALCVRSEVPALASRQAAAWDPLVDWAAQHTGARPAVSDSIFGPDQPRETVAAFQRTLEAMDDWQLTGVMALSGACRSLVAALALAEGRLRPRDAFAVLRLEENHQVEHWGYVEGGHDVDEADLRSRIAAPAVFLRLLREASADSAL